jgi:hypothetical protein
MLNQAMSDDSGSWWWWINAIGKNIFFRDFLIDKHQFVKKRTFSSGRINKHNYLI